MLLLNKNLVSKIESLKVLNKITFRIKFIFIAIICAAICYTMHNNIFQEYSFMIVSLLLTTFIINLFSDFFKSETDNLLDILEYDKSKMKHDRFDGKTASSYDL